MGLTAGGITMGYVPILANNAVVAKRNPHIYSFRIGELEAWSISDSFMLFDAAASHHLSILDLFGVYQNQLLLLHLT